VITRVLNSVRFILCFLFVIRLLDASFANNKIKLS
jgi:hypothetical protein